jgi:hypothetical protein
MKWIVAVLVLVAAIAFILGVIERIGGFLISGVSPAGFLRFANTCLFFAIALGFLDWRWHKKD